MNVRTERQTDRPHELHVYVGLAQARPNYIVIIINNVDMIMCGACKHTMHDYVCSCTY